MCSWVTPMVIYVNYLEQRKCSVNVASFAVHSQMYASKIFKFSKEASKLKHLVKWVVDDYNRKKKCYLKKIYPKIVPLNLGEFIQLWVSKHLKGNVISYLMFTTDKRKLAHYTHTQTLTWNQGKWGEFLWAFLKLILASIVDTA